MKQQLTAIAIITGANATGHFLRGGVSDSAPVTYIVEQPVQHAYEQPIAYTMKKPVAYAYERPVTYAQEKSIGHTVDEQPIYITDIGHNLYHQHPQPAHLIPVEIDDKGLVTFIGRGPSPANQYDTYGRPVPSVRSYYAPEPNGLREPVYIASPSSQATSYSRPVVQPAVYVAEGHPAPRPKSWSSIHAQERPHVMIQRPVEATKQYLLSDTSQHGNAGTWAYPHYTGVSENQQPLVGIYEEGDVYGYLQYALAPKVPLAMSQGDYEVAYEIPRDGVLGNYYVPEETVVQEAPRSDVPQEKAAAASAAIPSSLAPLIAESGLRPRRVWDRETVIDLLSETEGEDDQEQTTSLHSRAVFTEPTQELASVFESEGDETQEVPLLKGEERNDDDQDAASVKVMIVELEDGDTSQSEQELAASSHEMEEQDSEKEEAKIALKTEELHSNTAAEDEQAQM